MEELPIDWSHPALRQHLALVRLQMTTPLSLLINIACIVICSTLVNPSLQTISKLNPTPISPRPSVILVYVALIYLSQIGYCALLVLARKPETKSTLTKGVGLPLVFANWLMALWAIAWVFEWFVAATVLCGLLLLFLLYSNVSLLVYHPPTSSRPFDTALIHAPLRFFFVLQFALVFPLTLFIALGLKYTPMYDGTPMDPNAYGWPSFGVVLGTQLTSLLVVVLRRDIVWCVAATWICISLWSLRPKAQSVYITAIIFTVIHPLALLFTIARSYMNRPSTVEHKPDHGPVALSGDDSDHPALNPHPSTESQIQGPREVNVDEVWGA
ncbi:hypothetical protein MIND_00334300 [Mycena indigotica]|uniref:Uncharacterized protein n=1 Tax=Mycena indigotica TaxID=2126181 RepID=A0A8H6W9E8_9AGAR|nr:uncharacterized protein MIND_00334300 [Mycena indigotica]KAF7309632.1 hypothetical protein MIND_00334300 [Mycena indigotica]